MKKNKIKIILSTIILSTVVGFTGIAYATNASLYISPASLTKNVGNIFNVSMGVNTSGNKVCAVEGTLNFNNLSCQNITVGYGLMAQSTPSCSNPHFLIGIPNCSTLDRTLFTVSVKAGNAGVASINFTDVDVVGEGVSVGLVGNGVNYTINASLAVVPTSNTTPVSTSVKQVSKLATKTTEPVVNFTEPITTTQTSENNLLASVGTTGATSGWAYAFWTLLVLDIIYILAHGVYHIKKKRKQK